MQSLGVSRILTKNPLFITSRTVFRTLKPSNSFSGRFVSSTLKSPQVDWERPPRRNFVMASNLVWVDLEMTGLDLDKDVILEVACLVTDGDLNIIDEGLELVIHQSEEVLSSMNLWSLRHHGESGLTQRVRESKLSRHEVETKMLNLIQRYTKYQEGILCGNTIHMDKVLCIIPTHREEILGQTDANFQRLFALSFGGRQFDQRALSKVKKTTPTDNRWYPEEYANRPKKKGAHRALEDIKESIEELRFYRQTIFK